MGPLQPLRMHGMNHLDEEPRSDCVSIRKRMRKIYPVLIEKYDVMADLFWLLNVFDFQDEVHSNLQCYYQSTFCSPHAWGLAFVTASYKELGKLTQIVLTYHGEISSEIIVGQAATSPGISG